MDAQTQNADPDQQAAPDVGPPRPPDAAPGPHAELEHAWADVADLRQAQVRVVRKLGLLLPGVVRVLEIRRLADHPPSWRVSLAEATEAPGGAAVGEAGPTASTLRAHLSFETADVGLIYQLRPRRLRLAVDLLELQRAGPELGQHDVP